MITQANTHCWEMEMCLVSDLLAVIIGDATARIGGYWDDDWYKLSSLVPYQTSDRNLGK